ncbi:hypothetical protein D3C86_1554010 [compost metagenome]
MFLTTWSSAPPPSHRKFELVEATAPILMGVGLALRMAWANSLARLAYWVSLAAYWL